MEDIIGFVIVSMIALGVGTLVLSFILFALKYAI